MALGSVLMQTEGYASAPTMAAFDRARELSLRLGRADEYVMSCAAFGASLWRRGASTRNSSRWNQIGPTDLARLRPMSRVFHSVVLGLLELHLGRIVEASALIDITLSELAQVPEDERIDISGWTRACSR